VSKLLALIIEDDADLSEIYSRTLQADAVETEIVRDGTAALDRLKGAPPDVIVLDLHLPQVGGISVLNHIRDDKRFAKTVVIVTTADVRLADEARDRADLVLIKPVSVQQLRELTRRMLQRWHPSDPPA